MHQALANRRILLTRPADEAAALRERLHELGAVPVVFPAIAIEPIRSPALEAQLRRAQHADFVIYVSPSAVRTYFRALQEASQQHTSTARAVAIGPGTAHALRQYGVEQVLAPAQQFDSDGAAALPELAAIAGCAVAIVCGTGGRRTLGAALAARGAAVEHVECYRRTRPRQSPAELIETWGREGIAAALLTSSEGLRNLWEVIGETGRQLWRATPTFVPHERIKTVGSDLGLQRIIVTAPGDQAMSDALVDFFR